MKASTIIILFIAFFFTGCEKLEIKHDLIGKWKLFESGGGIAGTGARLNYTFLILDRKDDYQLVRNDTITEKGAYQISENDIDAFKDLSPYKIKFTQTYRLSYPTYPLDSYTYIIQNISCDTLGLYEPYIDGFYFFYKRE
jgi:hypothetical protein